MELVEEYYDENEGAWCEIFFLDDVLLADEKDLISEKDCRCIGYNQDE